MTEGMVRDPGSFRRRGGAPGNADGQKDRAQRPDEGLRIPGSLSRGGRPERGPQSQALSLTYGRSEPS